MARHLKSAALITVVFLVASCAGGSRVPQATRSSVDASISSVGGSADQAEVRAQMEAALASFDPNDIDGAIATVRDLDRRSELALADLEGMTEVLGGADAMAKAFDEADASVDGLAELLSEPVRFGFRRIEAAEPSVGMGLFGGFMLVAAGADLAVNSTNDGSTGSATLTDTGSRVATIEATADSAQVTMDVAHEGNGLATNLKAVVDISPCPDANGQFEIEATIDTTSTVTGTSKGQRGELKVKVTGWVDDNAMLVSDTTDVRFKRSGLAWGAFVDTSVRFSSQGEYSTKLEDFNWFTTTPEQINENLKTTVGWGAIVRNFLLKPAVSALQSGRCVTISYDVSPGTDGLAPSSAATITATARAKKDGEPAGGTISAQLSSGGQSVNPSSTPVPPIATFTYTAPSEAGMGGTVSLEARSRRGVGKADIVFTTVSRSTYLVDAMWGDFALSGSICGTGRPFRLDATSSYGSLIMNFTWTGETAGSIDFAGIVAEADITGTGTFVVDVDGEGGTLSITTNGTGVMGGFEVPTFVDSSTFPLQSGGACQG
jgi:hypothetical protein